MIIRERKIESLKLLNKQNQKYYMGKDDCSLKKWLVLGCPVFSLIQKTITYVYSYPPGLNKLMTVSLILSSLPIIQSWDIIRLMWPPTNSFKLLKLMNITFVQTEIHGEKIWKYNIKMFLGSYIKRDCWAVMVYLVLLPWALNKNNMIVFCFLWEYCNFIKKKINSVHNN